MRLIRRARPGSMATEAKALSRLKSPPRKQMPAKSRLTFRPFPLTRARPARPNIVKKLTKGGMTQRLSSIGRRLTASTQYHTLLSSEMNFTTMMNVLDESTVIRKFTTFLLNHRGRIEPAQRHRRWQPIDYDPHQECVSIWYDFSGFPPRSFSRFLT